MATVTVGGRQLLVAAVVGLALVVAYLLGSGGEPARAEVAPVAAETAGEPPQLTMSGRGTTTVVPDELGFTVTVKASLRELDDALDSSNRTMAKVQEALGEFGVTEADMRSSGLEMRPTYTGRGADRALSGYAVTQRMRVTVGELARGGDAISAVIETGGVSASVGDIRLGISDPDATMAEARADAVADATAKAEQYAEAAGTDLGAVVTIKEPTADRYADRDAAFNYGFAASLDQSLTVQEATAGVPIQAGESDLSVEVQVVWRLG